jgi:hypothetical protein
LLLFVLVRLPLQLLHTGETAAGEAALLWLLLQLGQSVGVLLWLLLQQAGDSRNAVQLLLST